jgi:hypothetical protein
LRFAPISMAAYLIGVSAITGGLEGQDLSVGTMLESGGDRMGLDFRMAPIVRSREPITMRAGWLPSEGNMHDRSVCCRTAAAKRFSGKSSVVATKQTSLA